MLADFGTTTKFDEHEPNFETAGSGSCGGGARRTHRSAGPGPGSVLYRSPESHLHEGSHQPTPAADVWSYAVTLYYAAIGGHPWDNPWPDRGPWTSGASREHDGDAGSGGDGDGDGNGDGRWAVGRAGDLDYWAVSEAIDALPDMAAHDPRLGELGCEADGGAARPRGLAAGRAGGGVGSEDWGGRELVLSCLCLNPESRPAACTLVGLCPLFLLAPD